MALLAWIISIAAFLGGFAAQTDLSPVHAETISAGLFVISALTCPFIWESRIASAMLDTRQRVAACLALVLALPLVLL